MQIKIPFILFASVILSGCDNKKLEEIAAENESLKIQIMSLRNENEKLREQMEGLSKLRIMAARATSQAAFSQLANGILKYKQTYGFYPDIATSAGTYTTASDTKHLLNGNPAYCHNLIKAVSGKQVTGAALTQADRNRFNRNAEEFYAFTREDYFDLNVAMAGQPVLVDRFGNRNLVLIFDTNNDGLINNVKLEGLPTALQTISTPKGISARVIIFTKGAESESDVIAVQ